MQENRSSLALGLFMPNCSNMSSISTYRVVEDEWTFDSNKAIARRRRPPVSISCFRSAAGADFGGETDYLGTSLETMTWASALLASTRRIQIFSTVHVPVFHPVVVARWARRSIT